MQRKIATGIWKWAAGSGNSGGGGFFWRGGGGRWKHVVGGKAEKEHHPPKSCLWKKWGCWSYIQPPLFPHPPPSKKRGWAPLQNRASPPLLRGYGLTGKWQIFARLCEESWCCCESQSCTSSTCADPARCPQAEEHQAGPSLCVLPHCDQDFVQAFFEIWLVTCFGRGLRKQTTSLGIYLLS